MNTNHSTLRHELMQSMLKSGTVHSAHVAEAFKAVPRHLFVPHVEPEDAYQDKVIAVKFDENNQPISSSSQPTMMAIMLEQLDLKPGLRILEIGAGTGYNAALMGHIVGDSGLVATVDIDDDLVEAAKTHLHAAGATNVHAICADGALGAPEHAPYDRIILTVAVWDVTEAWLKQLKPGGRMVMPLMLSAGTQVSAAFDYDGERLYSTTTRGCRFMTLRGQSEPPNVREFIDLPSGLGVQMDSNTPGDVNLVTHLLKTKPQVIRSKVKLNDNDLTQMWMWFGLYNLHNLTVYARGDLVGKKVIPALFGDGTNYEMTGGHLRAEGMALWGWKRQLLGSSKVFEMLIHAYGPQGQAISQRLLKALLTWDNTGRPGAEQMRITVVPRTVDVPPEKGLVILKKPSVNVLIRFNTDAP